MNTALDKYRRHILLGLTLFALLTFSVTGVMMTVFETWFRPGSPLRISLPGGGQATVTEDDMTRGRLLHQMHTTFYGLNQMGMQSGFGYSLPGFLFGAMPPNFTDSPGEAYAILRRVAIEQGIDVADQDVEASKRFVFRERKPFSPDRPAPKITALNFAQMMELGSEAELNELIRDALRISLLTKSEIMASVDFSDAAVADYVKEQRKRVTARWMAFDGMAAEEELKRTPPTDQDLMAYLKGKLEEHERAQFQHAAISAFESVGLLYDQANVDDFKEEIGDTVIAAADIEARYNLDKDRLYRREPPKEEVKPPAEERREDAKKPDDPNKEEAKDEDENGGLLAQDPPPSPTPPSAGPPAQQPDPQQPPVQQPPVQQPPAPPAQVPPAQTPPGQTPPAQVPAGPPTIDQVTYRPLTEVRDEIVKKLKLEAALRKLLEKAQKEWEATQPKPADKPGDQPTGGAPGAPAAPTQPAGDRAPEEGQTKKGGPQEQTPTPTPDPTKPAQGPPATSPPAEAPKPFDLEAWFKSVAKDRKGLVHVPAGAEQPATKFATYDPFGKWETTWQLDGVQPGQLSGSILTAEKGVFFLRVKSRQNNVWRDLEEIRKEALEIYYRKEASRKTKQQADDLRAEIAKKAEELKGEDAKKLRDGIAGKVAERLKAWQEDLDKKIAEKKHYLERASQVRSAAEALKKELQELEAQLAKREDKEKSLREAVEKEVEEDMKKLVAPLLGDAYDKVVAEKKLEVKELGPFFKDESSGGDPLFQQREATPEKFLKGRSEVSDGKENTVLDPLEDPTSRKYFLVRMVKIEDGGDEAVTRRTLAETRDRYARDRGETVLKYAYGAKALKKRYKFAEK